MTGLCCCLFLNLLRITWNYNCYLEKLIEHFRMGKMQFNITFFSFFVLPYLEFLELLDMRNSM